MLIVSSFRIVLFVCGEAAFSFRVAEATPLIIRSPMFFKKSSVHQCN